MKLLVLGIDGLSYRMVKHCAMPVIRELEKKSIAHGLLKSYPTKDGIPYTGPSWISIYTGMTPAQHGFELKGWIYGENHFDAVKFRTFFDELRPEHRAVSFTMPVTFPATSMPTSVKCISGFPAMPGGNRLVNDEALRKYTKGYLLDICDNPLYLRSTYACDYQENEKRRFVAARDLVTHLCPDVLFMGLTFIDKLNHQLPQADSRLRSAYHFLDNLVYEYLDFLKPDVVIMCSDHGFKAGIWDNNQHDLDGYYMFSNNKGSGMEREERLQYVSLAVADTLNIGRAWIGTPITRSHEVYTESEKELVLNRMKALGYIA